jgi:hypothetical protein
VVVVAAVQGDMGEVLGATRRAWREGAGAQRLVTNKVGATERVRSLRGLVALKGPHAATSVQVLGRPLTN